MRRFLLALVVIALAVPASGVIGPTTAQENTTATPTATPDPGENVSVQLSRVITISSWRYTGDTWVITFEAKLPSAIKVVDSAALFQALSEGEGSRAVDIPSQSYTIDAGTTTIRFQATTYDGAAAVTVGSTDGSVLLRTGSMSTNSPPVPMRTLQLAVLGTFLATGYGSYRITKEKMDDTDAMEADRII